MSTFFEHQSGYARLVLFRLIIRDFQFERQEGAAKNKALVLWFDEVVSLPLIRFPFISTSSP